MSNMPDVDGSIKTTDSFSENFERSGMTSMLSQAEMMMMMQRTNNDSMDLSPFNSEQKDKLLSLAEKGQDQGHELAKLQLSANLEIAKKTIDAANINQRTLKYVLLGGMIALFVITLIVLFFEKEFFIPILSFITGLCGGAGVKSLLDKFYSNPRIDIDENIDKQ